MISIKIEYGQFGVYFAVYPTNSIELIESCLGIRTPA